MCRVGRQTLLTHSLTALNISFALPPSSLLAVKALLEADVNVNDTKIFSDIKNVSVAYTVVQSFCCVALLTSRAESHETIAICI